MMKTPRRSQTFGKRHRWILILIIALLVPVILLLPRSRAQQGNQRNPQPDVVRMIGPVSQDQDLRELPYIPPTQREEQEQRLMRHPPGEREARFMRGARGVRGA